MDPRHTCLVPGEKIYAPPGSSDLFLGKTKRIARIGRTYILLINQTDSVVNFVDSRTRVETPSCISVLLVADIDAGGTVDSA